MGKIWSRPHYFFTHDFLKSRFRVQIRFDFTIFSSRQTTTSHPAGRLKTGLVRANFVATVVRFPKLVAHRTVHESTLTPKCLRYPHHPPTAAPGRPEAPAGYCSKRRTERLTTLPVLRSCRRQSAAAPFRATAVAFKAPRPAAVARRLVLLLALACCAHLPAARATTAPPDTLLTPRALRGQFTGQLRTFFMATTNQGGLTDYATQAVGGWLKWELSYRNLRLGLAGYSTNRLWGNPWQTDATVGRSSRYEATLYDRNHPDARGANLLGEAYLIYAPGRWQLTAGRFRYVSPLVNLQDGRMIPTLAEGVDVQGPLAGGWRWRLSYLHRLAPRGVVAWYRVDRSLGQLNAGRNPDGSRSGYPGALHSDGLLVAQLQGALGRQVRLSVWNFAATNIFNTFYPELTWTPPTRPVGLRLQLAYVRQDRLHNGGNADPNRAYFPQTAPAQVWSGQLTATYKSTQGTLAVNRVADGARFLLPREWGVELLYARLPRERTEGSANTWEWLAGVEQQLPAGWLVRLQAATYHRPDPGNFARNKYGLPSFYQLNAAARYRPVSLPALDLSLLLVHKWAHAPSALTPAQRFNAVGMTHYNLIANWTFGPPAGR